MTWSICDKSAIAIAQFGAAGGPNVGAGSVTASISLGAAGAASLLSSAGTKYYLPIQFGDQIKIVEESEGWYKGFNLETQKKGIFPKNHVQLKDSFFHDPEMEEIISSLREWSLLLKNYYKARKMNEFKMMKERLVDLQNLYRKVKSPDITEVMRTPLRETALAKIEEGRRVMGLDLLVRTANGVVATAENTPLITLYKMHKEMAFRDVPKRKTQSVKNKPQKLRTIKEHSTTPLICQLYLEFEVVICPASDPTDLEFSLWSSTYGPISENFLAPVSPSGLPIDINKIRNTKTIFRDVPYREFEDIYLVCKLIRRGKLLSEEKVKDKKPQIEFRRPKGVAVLPLQSLIGAPTEKISEFKLKLLQCTQEHMFHNVGELVVKRNPIIEPIPTAEGVIIGTRVYLFSDFNTLIDSEPSLKDVPVTSKLGFGEVIMPGLERNDLFVSFEYGEFNQDRKRAAKNIEVVLRVRKNTGELIKDCITGGSGEKPQTEYSTIVYYHTNSPHWDEIVRVNISPKDIPNAHFHFTVRHVSTGKPQKGEESGFANCYLGLLKTDGTIIDDDSYTLLTFKPPKPTEDPVIYLKQDVFANGSKFQRPKGEFLRVKIQVCSTKLTQNFAMYSLLKWKNYPGKVADILNRFTFVDKSEIIKFLQETFDAMFEILTSSTDVTKIADIGMLVFDALVRVIGILLGDRITVGFREVLDTYIEKHFVIHSSAASVHRHLVSCLKRSVSESIMKNPAKIVATLKSLEYIFKFIIASKLLHSQPTNNINNSSSMSSSASGISTSVPQRSYLGPAPLREPPPVPPRHALPTPPPRFGSSLGNGNVGSASGNGNGDEEFQKDLLEFFDSFNELMLKQSPGLIGAQTVALKSFTSWFSDLYQIFNFSELAQIASKFIDSVQDSQKTKLKLEKLTLINKLVQGTVFTNPKSRKILMPTISRQLEKHFCSSEQEEIQLSTEITSLILEQIQTKIEDTDSAAEMMVIFIGPLLRTLNQNNNSLFENLDIVSCLLCILYLLDPDRLENYLLQLFHSDMELLVLLLSTLQKFVKRKTYPDNWFAMSMLQYTTILKIISRTSILLAKCTPNSVLPPPAEIQPSEPQVSSETTGVTRGSRMGRPPPPIPSRISRTGLTFKDCLPVWENFFILCINCIDSSSLCLEKFSATKQENIRNKHGDIRVDISELFNRLWLSLGPEIIQFSAVLVGPFLQLMLQEKKELKQNGMDWYLSLLTNEFEQTHSFTRVETQTIDALDLIAEHGLDENFTKYFIFGLKERFQNNDKGRKFTTDMGELMELLYNLRNLPPESQHEDDRTMATLKLMEYLKQTERKDTYTKYIHMLCDQHIKNNNYIEAGYTLLLHSDLLEFSEGTTSAPITTNSNLKGSFAQYNQSLSASPSTSSTSSSSKQNQFQRKERLYLTAIEYFDKGKHWEKAISLVQELRFQYEKVVFDYKKLANILEKEASFFRSIIAAERFPPDYFLVGYYGKGFSPGIRNKQFVYRGFELERIGDFIQRIGSKYPEANMLKYTEPPGNEIINDDAQHIQIFSLRPSSKAEMEGGDTIKVQTRIPVAVQKYMQYNDVNVFSYSKPFRKGPKSDNEHKDLWVMKYFYITDESFPTIHRRSEITKKTQIEITPIQNAVNTVENKIFELNEMIQKYGNLYNNANINPFTMVLKGVIDAAVSGGVEMYTKAFFTPEYTRENPSMKEWVIKLKEALNEQREVLAKGLAIHKEICPPEMSQLQEQLETIFLEMKAQNY